MLWATLPFDDSLYAFSFDYGALVGELRTSLLRSAGSSRGSRGPTLSMCL